MTITHEGPVAVGHKPWRRALLGGLLVAVALAALGVAIAVWERPAGESTSAVVPDETALWPAPGSDLTFADARSAARSFSTAYAGFDDPVVGPLLQGDSRSGEVEVRPSADGPVTTVLVRQFGSEGNWWVLGAVSGSLQLESPPAMAEVASPLRLTGSSTAFEANVSVEIRQDGRDEPLATGYVMGGSMGEMGPFDGTFTFDGASAGAGGAVVLATYSMEDGSLWEVSVVRVRFA